MKNLNNKIATITIALILFIVAILIACVAVDAATPREFEYQPKTPAKQAMYEQKEYEKCLAEKELAQAKLEDVTNNVEIEVDLNEMKQKRNIDCLEIMTKEPAMPKVKSEVEVDIDKLARAVGWHETHDCQLGYGEMYNNCVGLKNGSIAPCEKIGNNNMCIYDDPEQSYEAFKAVWLRGYGDRLPTPRDASVYSGNDDPTSWRKNVLQHYNS